MPTLHCGRDRILDYLVFLWLARGRVLVADPGGVSVVLLDAAGEFAAMLVRTQCDSPIPPMSAMNFCTYIMAI